MKKLFFFATIFFFIGAESCNKLGNNGTYTIKGRMLKDCSGIPISIYSLRLYKGPSVGTPSKNLGITQTDLDGNFSFTGISVTDFESLSIFHDVDANTLTKWLDNYNYGFPMPENGQVVDLGTFYGSYQVNTVAKFDIDNTKFGTNDTLYIGKTTVEYQYFYPIPLNAVVVFSAVNNVPSLGKVSENGFGLIWGRTKKEMDSVFNIQPLKYHWFFSKAAICVYPDTSYFSIP